ncbi:hypothetical protein [Hyphomonas sp. CACIAM 19H1]|uniref:hypothetical protein n=1 Tax=Hyphomonas sp. CACIAM 19H1 TaxID=1873716 RepID=UPI0013B051A8|nr:hypothetical protein [Hyphomonas sp. CACIAM 19H1]
MTRTFLAAALFAATLSLSGCGGQTGETDGQSITRASSGKDMASAYVKEMTRVADALDGVTDEASARAAAAEIRTAALGMKNLTEALEGSGMKQVEAAAALSARAQDIGAAQMRIMARMNELQQNNPELAGLVGEEIDRLSD